ncbi:TPA: hypothetical protein I7662_20985 [Vibrio vulnificus]|nr:hypothetical protein [Vibrio vulnificus]
MAVSLRSSIAKRRSHLNAALCLIKQNQWFIVFPLFPRLFSSVLVGKLAFVSAIFWTSILWR